MKIKFFLFFLFIITIPISAQFNEYHPEYEWLTIKGEHIQVHFHREAERTAKTVLKIADEVWGPITSLYGYEPDEVHFVIKDIDDYSNGASYFFDNKIEIWASSLDFDLRGSHNWLRNVITHEFTHMVQLQAAMKLGSNVPAVYLQFLNYEDERRPDILYGFPNFIASYPVAGINVPAWFAEGTAQYQRIEFDYDNWDTHRDMILRSFVLDGKMLTWNEMGVFSKNSLLSEAVYNSGFALTNYIAQKYGEQKIADITKKLGKWNNFTMDAAVEDVLGISGNELYNEWQKHLRSDYEMRMKDVLENKVEGDIIAGLGFGNFYPVYSSDGSKIYYISNKSSDYFGLSSLYEYDVETKKEKMIAFPVRSTIGVISGEDKIIYAKLSDDNPNWAKVHDLYVYDISDEEETRLTNGLRANNPSVSPDGKKIAFVFQKDGTINIGSVDINGENFKRLTFFENGEQVYNPKFTPDGNEIVFGYSYHHGRDIAKVNVNGSGFEFILNKEQDERNPYLLSNGNMLYASDETGVFNIYEYNFTDKSRKRLTNVTGGAFMPASDNNGNIVYAGYTSDGYKIFHIERSETKTVDETKEYVWLENPPLNQRIPKGDLSQSEIDSLRNFNDYELPGYEIEEYGSSISDLNFFPFIRYDNYNTDNTLLDKFKPGVYIASSDRLNKYSLFAGGSINKRLERDLFATLEYKDKIPLIYNLGLTPEIALELYSISRKTNQDIAFTVDTLTNGTIIEEDIVNTDVSYSLLEFDFVASHKIFNDYTDLELRYIYSSYTATIGSFVLPDDNSLYPSTNDNYFNGSNFQVKLTTEAYIPTVDADINPIGRKIEIQYNYEMNEYNPDSEYEVADGILKPIYEDFNFHRLELNWHENHQIFNSHTISARLRAGSILGPEVPDFFDFYLGGLLGMKGYPFYAVSGNEIGWLNLTYRFPLFRNIDSRIGHLYLDKIYMSVYADIGNAWTGEFPSIDEFKKGAGAELRIKMTSFYLFPTSLFFNAAYSFDEFSRDVRGEEFKYGKEWRFYGGVLFDFNLY